MGHLFLVLVAAFIFLNLSLSNQGAKGALTSGRTVDEEYLNNLVEETMTMMTDQEKSEMEEAQKKDSDREPLENEQEFQADIAELPENVDCFGFPSWIVKPLRKLFSPQTSSVVNTHFFLATRNNRESTKVPSGEEFSPSTLHGFDPSHRTVVIVHGFLSGGNEEWIVNMTNALLDKVDANVFAVDWSGGAGSWRYWEAVANTRVAGNDIAKFIEKLINEAGLRTDDLHLIGHSLGAHICGFVSRSLGKVSRITGLDPAQPCFITNDTSMTLDAGDAEFVDVIHTNGRMLSRVGLGLPNDLGHSDFYPHGGMVQPECKLERKLSSWKSLWRSVLPNTYMLYKKFSEAICSHGCAYVLFTESLRKSSSCIFWGHPWDKMRSESEDTVFERPCDIRHCSEMGYNSNLYPARGGFYVKATDEPPHCVSNKKTDDEMAS